MHIKYSGLDLSHRMHKSCKLLCCKIWIQLNTSVCLEHLLCAGHWAHISLYNITLFPTALEGQVTSAPLCSEKNEAQKYRRLVQSLWTQSPLLRMSVSFTSFLFNNGNIFPSVGKRSKAQVFESEQGEPRALAPSTSPAHQEPPWRPLQ